MPVANTQRTLLKDFSEGVISKIDADFIPIDLSLRQLISCKNAFWRAGLQKRKGMVKVSANQVNGSNAVVAVHRFYRRSAAKQLLASSGGNIEQLNETTGAFTTLKTGLNPDTRIFLTTYGPTERVLIADGLSTPLSWDGTTLTNFTTAPAGAKEFVVHRERVFAYQNNVSISYSDNLDPDAWNIGIFTLATSDPFITKMIVHTQSTANTSVLSQLLVFTTNSVWVLAGNDFEPSTLSDVSLEEVSGQIGTSSPNSVVKTPRGVIFFGRQQGRNNAFLIVGEGQGAQVIPIGNNIRKELEGVPVSGMDKVAATYFDGFYRLSIRSAGNTDNKTEWWLDVDNLSGESVSWYGPMVRNVGLQHLAPLSGSNDNNILYAGGEDGYLYWLEQSFDDDGVSIPVDIRTGFYDFGFFSQQKEIEQVFIIAQSTGGDIDVSVNSDFQAQASETTKSVALAPGGGGFPYTFPITFVTTVPPDFPTVDFSQSEIQGTYMSMRVEFDNVNKNFILNSLGIKYRVSRQDNPETEV